MNNSSPVPHLYCNTGSNHVLNVKLEDNKIRVTLKCKYASQNPLTVQFSVTVFGHKCIVVVFFKKKRLVAICDTLKCVLLQLNMATTSTDITLYIVQKGTVYIITVHNKKHSSTL